MVGRLLGSQGVSLEETLADLRTTYELVLGTEPAFTDACAVALGWSEATLAYLHQLSCADPLTGLASMAHLRGRLTELYRGVARGSALRDRYALVVIEASAPRLTGLADEVFGLDLRMSRIGESARSVFSGGETICRIGPRRIVVLASRDESLGRRTALLRSLTDLGERGHGGVRIWTESLPLAADRSRACSTSSPATKRLTAQSSPRNEGAAWARGGRASDTTERATSWPRVETGDGACDARPDGLDTLDRRVRARPTVWTRPTGRRARLGC